MHGQEVFECKRFNKNMTLIGVVSVPEVEERFDHRFSDDWPKSKKTGPKFKNRKYKSSKPKIKKIPNIPKKKGIEMSKNDKNYRQYIKKKEIVPLVKLSEIFLKEMKEPRKVIKKKGKVKKLLKPRPLQIKRI